MRTPFVLAVVAALAVTTAASAAAAEPRHGSTAAPAATLRTAQGQHPAAARAAAVSAQVGQCRGDTCDGKRSTDYGCDADRLQIGGFTTTSSGHPTTDVAMWYSDACNAVWGTFDEHAADSNLRQLTLQCLDQYSGQPLGSCGYLQWVTGHETTTMGGWNHSFQLCVDLSSINPSAPCTGWR